VSAVVQARVEPAAQPLLPLGLTVLVATALLEAQAGRG
jgi:hypothetical protein